MKKKLIAALLCTSVVLSMTGCGKSSSDDADTSTSEVGVTLGDYKGLEVYKSTNEVTDDELQDYMDYILENNAETTYLTEGTVKKDDTLKIDYVGKVDDKEYDNGSATGKVLKMSDDAFDVDGFVEGLIGHKVGEVVTLNLKFADDYATETLKGKAVVFTVTIQGIQQVTIPTLTEEFIKAKFEYLNTPTIEEFKNYWKEELRLNDICNEVWQTVLDNATVLGYDSDEKSELVDQYKSYYESQISSTYGMTLSDYLAAVSQTEDEFTTQIKTSVESYLKQKMVIEAIAKAENIEITSDYYTAEMTKYAKSSGYDTIEEFESAYSSHTEDDFKFEFLARQVQDFVSNKTVVVDDPPETTTSEEGTTAAK